MLIWIFFAGVGYLVLTLVFAYVVQRVPRRPVHDPPDWGRVEDRRIPSIDGGFLEVWRVTPDTPNGQVVLFAHGWGRNRDRMVARARIFAGWGYTSVMHSARDHGNSSLLRFVNTFRFAEDIETVMDWINRPVILYGHSAGSGGAIIAAVRNPDRIQLLFLEASYADTREALKSLYKWANSIFGMMFGRAIVTCMNLFYRGGPDDSSPERLAPHLDMPVMLIHGENDRRLPARFARRLHAAFRPGQAKLFIAPGAGHSGSSSTPEYGPAIADFLEVNSLRAASPKPEPCPEPDTPVFIAAGWVVDGSGGSVRQNLFVEIVKGRLRAVRPLCPEDLNLAHIMDFRNHTLLPGLIDSHVHLFMSATEDETVRQEQLQATYPEVEPVIHRHLEAHAACGILSVRDAGDYGGFALRYASENGDNRSSGVRVQAAGRAWRQAGRYGRLIGRPPVDGYALGEAVARSSEPSDHVKIVNSGLNSLTIFGRQTEPQFSLETLRSAVRAADSRGLRVMVHANGEIPVRLALEAGCASVEHGYFMGRKNLEQMAERQTAWVPTLMPMKAYAEILAPGSKEADVCRQTLDHQLQQVREGRRLGVNLVLGTDAGAVGVHHGEAVREEMKLLSEAGLTVPELVHTATFAGAKLAGIHNLGLIQPGYSASFLIVPGTPDELPGSLSRICYRMVDGSVKNPISELRFIPRHCGVRK